MARGPVLHWQKQSSRVLRPKWNAVWWRRVVGISMTSRTSCQRYQFLLLLLLLLLSGSDQEANNPHGKQVGEERCSGDIPPHPDVHGRPANGDDDDAGKVRRSSDCTHDNDLWPCGGHSQPRVGEHRTSRRDLCSAVPTDHAEPTAVCLSLNVCCISLFS